MHVFVSVLHVSVPHHRCFNKKPWILQNMLVRWIPGAVQFLVDVSLDKCDVFRYLEDHEEYYGD